MYCDGDGYADFVPADIAANALILIMADYIETNG